MKDLTEIKDLLNSLTFFKAKLIESRVHVDEMVMDQLNLWETNLKDGMLICGSNYLIGKAMIDNVFIFKDSKEVDHNLLQKDIQENLAKVELFNKTKEITKEIITLLNENPNVRDQLSNFIFESKGLINDSSHLNVDGVILNSEEIKKVQQMPESKKIDLKTNQAFNRSDTKLKMLTDEELKQKKEITNTLSYKDYINNLPIAHEQKTYLISLISHN